MRKLTPKQEIFAVAYLACRFNATQAAIDAGYNPRNARFYGSRLLTKANIRAEISRLTRAIFSRIAARERGETDQLFGFFDLDRLPATPGLAQNRVGELVPATVRRASGAELQAVWTPAEAIRLGAKGS